ncbi:MAG: hypothetical protein KJ060_19330 [Candidatus Hydrogenedentes bacterium]|nr:hypothetical protein [Candidatus Hydrogenedentota bacterium]
MSNRAFLTRTKFEAAHDGASWGWRIGDDYVRSYTDARAEHEVPADPLGLLANAAAEATEDERQLLENLLRFERGMSIDGSWHDYDEIAPVLRRALNGGED